MTSTDGDTETTSEYTTVPESLREYPQWVCWTEQERDGKLTKIPVDPRTGEYASTNDAGTWTDFENAVEHADTTDHITGIGFVFTDDDPIVGVDLDDCRNPETGHPDKRADDILTRLDSYTEVSPSGTGYHVLLEGALPDGRSRRGSIEMYDSGRFFTVTGTHVEGTPRRVAPRQDALTAIHEEYVARDTAPDAAQQSRDESRASGTDASESSPTELDDATLIEKARGASNGEKFTQLWRGDTSGYASHSEADMALCFILAFWTNGDAAQMDRLFRRSGLMREKWDEVHYADGTTYGEMTIERAITHSTEGYDPERSRRESDAETASQQSNEFTREERYTQEKVRLLEDRLRDLETLLEEKNERIATLEATLETLRESEAAPDGEEETTGTDRSRTQTTLARVIPFLDR